MDSSLARGIKNQFFKDIDHEISLVTKRFTAYTIKSKIKDCKRANWERYVKGINDFLGIYLLCGALIGGKRNSTLCLYLIEDDVNRSYNSWNENCLTSEVICIRPSPYCVDVKPLGFNISEHSIQRMIERIFEKNMPIDKKILHKVIFEEMIYVPYFTGYWIFLAVLELNAGKTGSIQVLIPSPNGMFIGEIQPQKMNRCEIRTFFSNDMLSNKQYILKNKMIDLWDKEKNHIIPFFMLSITGVINADKDSTDSILRIKDRMENIINDFNEK